MSFKKITLSACLLLMACMTVFTHTATGQVTSQGYNIITGTTVNTQAPSCSAGTCCTSGTIGATSLGLYANNSCSGGVQPEVVVAQTFTTTGISNTGTARPLQPGDSFVISYNSPAVSGFETGKTTTGSVGISFNDNTTYSLANYNLNQRAAFELDAGTGNNWYGKAATNATTFATPGASRMFYIKVTSTNTVILGVPNGTGSPVATYDLGMLNSPGTSASIKSFVIWDFGQAGGNSTVLSNYLVSTGAVYFGGSNNAVTVSGIIADGLQASNTSTPTSNKVVINGNGSKAVTLSGANTYTGSTTINSGGTLTLGVANAIPTNSAGLILNGGTLNTGIYSDNLGTGTLQLLGNGSSATSTINLGSGTLKFADSHGVTWTSGKSIVINGWYGIGGQSGSGGHIYIGSATGTLTSTQLAQISFSGYTGTPILLSTGELVPPTTTAPGISGFTFVGGGTGYTADQTTITGNNFTNITGVTIGGVTASYIVNSSTSITVTVPQSGASGSIVVSSSNSGGTTGSIPGFTYLGYITTAASDWNTASTWRGGAVPPIGFATTVANAITINTVTTNTPSQITISSGGTATLGVANAIPSGVNIILNGGTLSTGSSAGYSDNLGAGTLMLLANSTISFGTGTNTLTFANSSAVSWTGSTTLTVNGWTGLGGATGTAAHLNVSATAGLTSGQLSQVSFTGYVYGTSILTGGEVVPSATPAPTISSFSFISTGTGYTGDSIAVTGTYFYGVTGVTIGGVAAGYKIRSTTLMDVAVPPAGASGSVVVTTVTGTATKTGFTYLGYVTVNATDWNTASTWNGSGGVPTAGAACTIVNAITINSTVTNTPGSIQINTGGSVTLGAANVIPSTVNLILNGGSFNTGSSTGYSDNLGGTLKLLANSTINLGTGVHTITFGGSSAVSWNVSATLTVNGWTGLGSATGTAGQIIVGSSASDLSAQQISQVSFTGVTYTNGTTQLSTGEVVPINPLNASISSFSPTSGYTGDTIVITGNNFTGTTLVTVNGVSTGFRVVNINTINAAVPQGTNSGAISVTASGSAAKAGFTYLGYITTTTGDWNTGATWRGGGVPSASVPVTVATAITMNSAVTNAASSLTVTSAGTLTYGASGTLSSGPVTINSGGLIDMTSGGTLTLSSGSAFANSGTFTGGTGTVVFAGSSTVTGTNPFKNVTISGGVNFGSASTINGNLQINNGGYVNTNAPTYASGSTLVYNTTANPYTSGAEWTTGSASAVGVPYNVTIQNTGVINFSGSAYRQLNGSLIVSSGAGLALSTTSGGDLRIAGSWSGSGTFTSNGRNVTFNGTGTQTVSSAISVTASGYIIINSGSTVSLAANVGTFNLTENGTLSLSSYTFTVLAGGICNFGASSIVNAGSSTISCPGYAAFNFTAGSTFNYGTSNISFIAGGVSAITGTVGLYNVTLATGVSFSSTCTINNNLQINGGGYVSTNAPLYATGSTLVYNAVTNYGVGAEWKTNATSGVGVPYNVMYQNAASMNFGGGTTPFTCNGNYTINTGCTVNLSGGTGGDLHVGGNWSCAGTLNHNNRAVSFVGTIAQQYINGPTTSFGYLTINNSMGVALGATQKVADNIILTSGSLILGNYNLYMTGSGFIGSSAGSITGATATNYVQTNGTGLLRHFIGTGSTYTFPIGNSENDSISITNPSTADTIGVRVVDGQLPGLNDPAKSVLHGWIVSQINTTNQMVVKLQWNHPADEGSAFASGTSPYIGLLHLDSRNTTSATAGGSVASPHFTAGSDFTAVYNGDTLAAGLDDAFLNAGITSFTPASGYTGTSLTFYGANFSTLSTVTIGGVPASVTNNAITSVTVTVGTGASGSITASTSGGNVSSITAFTYLGYITQQAGDWNTGSTWLGGNVPPAGAICTVANAVTLNGAANSAASVTIASGGTLTFGAAGSITANAININNACLLDMTNGGSINVASGGTFTNSGLFTYGTGTINFLGGSVVTATAMGYNNVTLAGNVNLGTGSTIYGNLQINAHGSVNSANPPIYATGSNLIYSTAGPYGRSNEWTTVTGGGYPYNVIIVNTNLNIGNNGNAAQIAGSLIVDSAGAVNMGGMANSLSVLGNVLVYSGKTVSGSLALSTSIGGDLNVAGNWTCNGTFTSNSRAVAFNGTANQTINNTSAFGYVTIANTADTVKAPVGFSTSGDLTVNASAILTTNGGVTVSGTPNINGTFQINAGGYIGGTSPTYGSSSTLVYNSGGNYGVGTEWAYGIASGVGVPNNVVVSKAGTHVTFGTTASYHQLSGNLTVNSGSTFTLGTVFGGDLQIGGNWTVNGTFTNNSRLVTFNGSSAQSINTNNTFAYATVNNSAGVNLNANTVIKNNLTLTSGSITLGNYNLTDSGSISGYSSTQYVVTNGTGLFKQTVGNTATIYPIGNSEYNPATITNSGSTDLYGVRVVDGASALNNAAKAVNKLWVTSKGNAGAGNIAVKLQWNHPSDENASYASGTTDFIGDLDYGIRRESIATLGGTTSTPTFTSTTNFTKFENGDTLAVGKDDAITDSIPGCSGAPSVATITPATTSACSPSSLVTLTATGAASQSSQWGIVYQWEKLVGSQWIYISGANSTTYVATGISAATSFRFMDSCANTGAKSYSSVANILLPPTAKFSPYTNLSVCTGPVSLPVSITGVSPWTIVYNDGVSNHTITGATGTPYSLNVNPLATTTYRIRSVTDANGCASSAIGSSANSYADSARKVTLYAPKGGSVTPALSTVCSGSNQTFSITGDTGTHIQWQYTTNANASSSSWINYGTLDSTSATLPNVTGTTYVRALVNVPGCVTVASTDGEVKIDSSAIKVSVNNISSTAATINWTLALGATSYTIVYNGNTVVAGNVTSYNLTGLSSCTAYSVSVTSNTSNCGGARSGSGSFNTSKGNLALTLTQGVTYKVTASWSAGVGPYKLYIGSIDNLNSLQVFNVTGTTYTTTNAWPGYTVAAYVVDLGSTCTPLAQSALQQINVAGGNCTTGAPVITARASTANTFTVQWSGSSSNGYQFFYKNTNGSGSWYSYYTAGNSMTINGCAPGNCYAVYVQNVCSNSKGYTTAVDTICTAAVCTSPLNLLLSKATCNGFTATWNSVAGATAYQVYMTLTSASGSPITYSYTVTGSPYTVAIFGRGVAISVYVKTQNCNGSNGMSAASNVESITTLSTGCKDDGDAVNGENSSIANAITNGSFSVYPNPNNGTFKVNMTTLSTDNIATLEVIDMLGRTLYTKEISNNNGTILETIDMGNIVSSGLYMVRVRCGNDTHIAKVQIQR